MSKCILTFGDFLNVDVEVTSRRRSKSLADELETRILYHGKIKSVWLLTFEMSSIQGKSTPDGVIGKLCKLIENLSPAARAEWDAAQSRVFDVGFEAAPRKKGQTVIVRSMISEDSLRRIVGMRGRLAITCYRPFKPRSPVGKK
jgi:hypothetical protein